jgi:hypothetical protein
MKQQLTLVVLDFPGGVFSVPLPGTPAGSRSSSLEARLVVDSLADVLEDGVLGSLQEVRERTWGGGTAATEPQNPP